MQFLYMVEDECRTKPYKSNYSYAAQLYISFKYQGVNIMKIQPEILITRENGPMANGHVLCKLFDFNLIRIIIN